jgi:ADP-heptose:LPS heptosyltransferase
VVPLNPSRILFIAEGQLGDLLVLTPAIRAMKRTFSPASVSVLIFQRRSYFRNSEARSYFHENSQQGVAAVLRSNPHVDEVMEVDLQVLRRLGWWSRARAEIDIMARLRRKRFDTAIVFPRDRFVLWAFASGANIRVGQKEQVYHQLLTHTPDIHKSDTGVINYYCQLVASTGAVVDSLKTEFFVKDSARQAAWAFLRNEGISDPVTLIAIHPGASANDRVWPPERYARLIDVLQSDGSIRVLLCGSSFDGAIVKMVQATAETVPLVVQTGEDIDLLAALLEKCALFIGNNSGPRHLAAAVRTPTLALLTRNDEFEWRGYHDERSHRIMQGKEACPVCPDGVCEKKIPDGEQYGSHCMRMISVESVALIARNILQQRNPDAPGGRRDNP